MSTNQNSELYVLVNNPDQRKRVTITYEKNENEKECNVMVIPDNLVFRSFLGLIITKFKLDPTCRSHIRVKTNDHHRIKSLNGIYNNQLLTFSISEISEIEDEENLKQFLTKSQEFQKELAEKLNNLKIAEKQYLSLFTFPLSENNNKFNKIIINQLTQHFNKSNNNSHKLIIGESFPYKVKILFCDIEKDSRIWLYIMEKPSTTQQLEYTFDLIIESKKVKSNEINDGFIKLDIINYLNKQYQIDNNEIIKMVQYVQDVYANKSKFPLSRSDVNSIFEQSCSLFPDLEKLKTVSQNKLIDQVYSNVNQISKYYNIPNSLSKKLLFQNKWDVKSIIGNSSAKNENHTNIRVSSYPHKVKDISSFKFNSLDETLDKEAEIECSICYCEYSSGEMTELLCGHKFCNGCLVHYFESSINDGNGASSPISCPSTGCLNKCIDEVTVESLLIQAADAGKSKLAIESLGNLVRDLLYSIPNCYSCPELNCNRLVIGLRSTKRYAPYISCDGHIWCLFCKKSGLHWPISCKRPQYSDGDLFSFRWIVQNTTICGRCKSTIERNGGCSHMTCSKCRYEFCYTCGADYRTHGSCSTETNSVKLGKIKQFFDAVGGKEFNIDSGFMEEFFLKGTFITNDPLIKHIYQSFLTMITEKQLSSKKHLQLVQSAIFFLHNHTISRFGSAEEKSALDSCQKSIKKLLRPDIVNVGYSGQTFDNDSGPPVKSLCVTVCANGSKKSLTKLFVNTQFPLFKQEIVNALNKLIPEDQVEYDSKKIRMYNLYGGQIKSSNEILNDEPIFITSSIHEPFIEPTIPMLTLDEIEIANTQIQEFTVMHLRKLNTFTVLQPVKEKRKNDLQLVKEQIQIQIENQEFFKNNIATFNNNNNNNSGNLDELITEEIRDQYFYYRNLMVDEESEDEGDFSYSKQLVIDDRFLNINSDTSSSEDSDSEDLESDSEKQEGQVVDKEQKRIETVFKIIELYKEKIDLDFDFVYSIVGQAKSFSCAKWVIADYLEGESKEYALTKEKLISSFPQLSIKTIDRAIRQSNNNIDQAKYWIHQKHSRQQKKQYKLLQQQEPNSKIPDRRLNISETYYQDTDDEKDLYEDADDQEDLIQKTIFKNKNSKFNDY